MTTKTIEIENENGQTISSIQAELDRLNEEAVNLINSPVEPGQPVLVKIAGLTDITNKLLGDKDALQQRQEALDKYAAHCAEREANRARYDKLKALEVRAKQLYKQLNRLGVTLSYFRSPDPAIARNLADMGVPTDKVLEVERKAREASRS